ncbi:N-formylglutamate deformylase [Azohydromonas aeria]|uniref:N-formylglutamate deformylase n=1 Tax=Azohydromonas aeria TaxID=2590212 RepID=UPI0012F9969A|nr:N-formylglutamate deformylase [Azohydromonas aeria]
MTQEPLYTLVRGTRPLLISIPHLGTRLPGDIAARMNDVAPVLRDTDWHLDRLYGFAAGLGASVLQARVSRYAIDLNRPPGGESLYPGQATTGLCPVDTFRGEPLYRPGHEPDAAEQARRLQAYWRPYHDALAAEVQRLREAHGAVLLWDAHSIASHLPRLFEGKLPDLNFGTDGGRTCDAELMDSVLAVARDAPFTHVVNGRFKGGYITRHYGAPRQGVHAIQLEMCQSLYMREEPPFDYLPDTAARVQPVLQAMLEAALGYVERRAGR